MRLRVVHAMRVVNVVNVVKPRALLLALAAGALAAGVLPARAHAQAAPDGAALFAQHCASCHQPDGAGTVGLAPALKGEHWTRLGADRSYLLRVVLFGLSGPIKVNGQPFVGSMPTFAATLDDAALAAVATHVRTKLHGAADAPFAADEVKAQREKAGSPPQSRAQRVQLVGP